MTQKDRILEYLKSGKTLTRWIGLMDLGIWETPARICDLKSDGYRKNIVTKLKPDFNQRGEPIVYAEWSWKK